MRRRVQRFLPIVLIALLAQILAPIAACWVSAIAISDPLASVEICHSNAGGNSGQTNDRADDGGCALCGILLADAPLHTPQCIALSAPYRNVERVVWDHVPLHVHAVRTGSNSQARAPPRAI